MLTFLKQEPGQTMIPFQCDESFRYVMGIKNKLSKECK
jgi:hypothetical protein